MQFPDGFAFVSYEPVPGWNAKVTMEKSPRRSSPRARSDRAGRSGHLDRRRQAGHRGPGQFQDFGLSAQIPDKPGTKLTFKALQTYEGGEVVRWIGAPDSDEPAPQVTVTAGGEEHGAAADERRPRPSRPRASRMTTTRTTTCCRSSRWWSGASASCWAAARCCARAGGCRAPSGGAASRRIDATSQRKPGAGRKPARPAFLIGWPAPAARGRRS